MSKTGVIVCQTLGPPVARLADGSTPADLQWHKNLALLVYLARSPKQTRTRDHLIGLLWGDRPEEKARHSLNVALGTLRSYAGDAVEADRTHVRLEKQAAALDVEQLEALAAAGKYEAAAELIAGVFLEGVAIAGASAFDDWMSAERAYWQRRSVEVLVCWSGRLLAAGNWERAERAAHRAQEIDPSSSEAARAAMRAIALGGDGARAVATFTAFTERLKRDTDAHPDPEISALAARIRDDRSLRPRASGPAERRAPLVGRGAELERLVDLWRQCCEGRGAIALIVGDSGTGKSRLAEELARRARVDGALVIAARAVEADQSDQWGGILGIARGGLLEARGIASTSPTALSELRGTTAPRALARGFAEALTAVAEEQPVLVVVDDVHWLDHESLLALGAAARDVARRAVMLVITASSQRPRAELDEIRARIGRELEGTAVVVRALGGDALRALVHWAIPSYDSVQLERLSRRIVADTAGIPLLAIELLQAVALGMDLQQVQNAWPEPMRTLDQTLPGDLPDALTAAIRVNFRRLSPDAQRVLVVAAVLGGRVSAAQLTKGTGLAGDVVTTALDELEWTRWLAVEARGYSFVARILRDVIDRDMVLSGERQRILDATSSAQRSRSR